MCHSLCTARGGMDRLFSQECMENYVKVEINVKIRLLCNKAYVVSDQGLLFMLPCRHAAHIHCAGWRYTENKANGLLTSMFWNPVLWKTMCDLKSTVETTEWNLIRNYEITEVYIYIYIDIYI